MQSVLDECVLDADEAEKEKERSSRAKAARRRRAKQRGSQGGSKRVAFLCQELDSESDMSDVADSPAKNKAPAGKRPAKGQGQSDVKKPRPKPGASEDTADSKNRGAPKKD